MLSRHNQLQKLKAPLQAMASKQSWCHDPIATATRSHEKWQLKEIWKETFQ